LRDACISPTERPGNEQRGRQGADDRQNIEENHREPVADDQHRQHRRVALEDGETGKYPLPAGGGRKCLRSHFRRPQKYRGRTRRPHRKNRQQQQQTQAKRQHGEKQRYHQKNTENNHCQPIFSPGIEAGLHGIGRLHVVEKNQRRGKPGSHDDGHRKDHDDQPGQHDATERDAESGNPAGHDTTEDAATDQQEGKEGDAEDTRREKDADHHQLPGVMTETNEQIRDFRLFCFRQMPADLHHARAEQGTSRCAAIWPKNGTMEIANSMTSNSTVLPIQTPGLARNMAQP
jgi:hypothetical protein